MIVRVIVQTSKSGEKHVTMTADQDARVHEFLVTSPDWEDSEVVEGRALLLGMDESDVTDDLVDVELHTAWTHHNPLKILLGGSNEAV